MQASMPGVGFEPTTPMLERTNTIYALDCAATMVGSLGASPSPVVA
jgi:hypothetical protein